jgi:pantetheine-phosphate adenylyltransferase
MTIRALYPGTFDPFHRGHFDIATRAYSLFAELIVAVYENPTKHPLFSVAQRVELVEQSLEHLPSIHVVSYRGLTVDFAREIGANVMVRGLRNVGDYQFEHQIGWANWDMAPEIDTCCLFCDRQFAFLSSTILKEVVSLGQHDGSINNWASEAVMEALYSKYAETHDGVVNESVIDEEAPPHRRFARPTAD